MAQFGLRYFAQLHSKYKGVFWRVEIAERGYVFGKYRPNEDIVELEVFKIKIQGAQQSIS